LWWVESASIEFNAVSWQRWYIGASVVLLTYVEQISYLPGMSGVLFAPTIFFVASASSIGSMVVELWRVEIWSLSGVFGAECTDTVRGWRGAMHWDDRQAAIDRHVELTISGRSDLVNTITLASPPLSPWPPFGTVDIRTASLGAQKHVNCTFLTVIVPAGDLNASGGLDIY
jgi:hypothetical protein